MNRPTHSLPLAALLAAVSCGAPETERPSGNGTVDECTGEEALTTPCRCTPALASTPRCAPDPAAWSWGLPPSVPAPVVPTDLPMTEALFQLGRHLFYDPRLSENQTQSCASCHRQDLAFSDGLALAVGSTGEVHPRNSMALMNVGYVPRLTWANPLLDSLEVQAMLPIFGEFPIVELGMMGKEDLLLERIADDPDYVVRFAQAFPNDATPISVGNLVRALGAFQRALVSFDSPWDRYLRGEGELSLEALRGAELFFDERLECFHCHGGLNFSDTILHTGLPTGEVSFHHTGLYNLDGAGAYPPQNTGIHEITGRAEDTGRFRAPSLRNVAVSAPYMHDGSIATLDEVIDHYAAGGRTIEDGPWAGVGSESPLRSEFIVGFVLTDEERGQLIAFLESLTDETFLTTPRYADPFTAASHAESTP